MNTKEQKESKKKRKPLVYSPLTTSIKELTGGIN